MNINSHMFRDEFVVKRGFFYERWSFILFPEKTPETNELGNEHCFWRSKHDLIYLVFITVSGRVIPQLMQPKEDIFYTQ